VRAAAASPQAAGFEHLAKIAQDTRPRVRFAGAASAEAAGQVTEWIGARPADGDMPRSPGRRQIAAFQRRDETGPNQRRLAAAGRADHADHPPPAEAARSSSHCSSRPKNKPASSGSKGRRPGNGLSCVIEPSRENTLMERLATAATERA